MYAIIGAAGNVGRSTSHALRNAGCPVRAILRDTAKGTGLKEIGCEIAVADIQDAAALAQAIAGADAVQIVIPLRPRAKDPLADMHRSIEGMLEAIERAGIKSLLLVSDYGAHVDHDIGMPSVFHAAEARVRRHPGHVSILRSAEHMHNWARSIPAAIESGTLVQFQDPLDTAQPTIAAQDLGSIAAEILQMPHGGGVEVVHAEGPRRYSARDVAAALGQLAGRSIQAVAVPREQWSGALAKMPPSLADLLIKANDAKNQGGLVDVEPNAGDVRRGATELGDALRPFVTRQ